MPSIPACTSGLTLVLLVHLCAGRWNFLDDYGHRIRHKRNWKMDRYQFEEAKECPALKDEPDYKTCPKKRCHTNQDCWTATGSAHLCLCDRHLCGLVCVSIDAVCDPLADLENGNINIAPVGLKGSPQPGGLANYTCNKGFTLKGHKQRVCKANGRWTGYVPTCISQRFCDRPPEINMTINDADPNLKKFLAGKIITYQCQEGYSSVSQTSKKICSGELGWTGPNLKCERKNCQMPRPLKNGRYINKGLHYKGKFIYVCHLGYRLVCLSGRRRKDCQVRVCQANGKWSGGDGYCERIRCPELMVPLNGRRRGPYSSTMNSLVTFECNPGYYLDGSKTRRCQKDGKWDGTNVVCKMWDCGLPPYVPFSRVKYTNTIYGSTARYTCVKNSSFVGESPLLRCGPSGNWLPRHYPQCLSHCSLLKVSNGSVRIDKFSNDTKKEDNQNVPHAYTITVKCSTGYELREPVHPRCDNGSWSSIPICEPAPCFSRPPIGSHSQARFYSLSHGSKAVYTCNLGFNRTMGNEVLRCLFGKWVGKPLKCSATKCTKPPTPKNGMIYLMGAQGRWPYKSSHIQSTHNEVIEYRCNAGYRLNGQPTAVCLNSRWSPSETPACELILHKPLPIAWVLYKPRNIKQPS